MLTWNIVRKNKFKACQVCFPTHLSSKVAIYSHWQVTMLGKRPDFNVSERVVKVFEGVRKPTVHITET